MRGLTETNTRLVSELSALTAEVSALRGRCAYAEDALCAEVERGLPRLAFGYPMGYPATPRPDIPLPAPTTPLRSVSQGTLFTTPARHSRSMYDDAREALAFRMPLSPLGARF